MKIRITIVFEADLEENEEVKKDVQEIIERDNRNESFLKFLRDDRPNDLPAGFTIVEARLEEWSN